MPAIWWSDIISRWSYHQKKQLPESVSWGKPSRSHLELQGILENTTEAPLRSKGQSLKIENKGQENRRRQALHTQAPNLKPAGQSSEDRDSTPIEMSFSKDLLTFLGSHRGWIHYRYKSIRDSAPWSLRLHSPVDNALKSTIINLRCDGHSDFHNEISSGKLT